MTMPEQSLAALAHQNRCQEGRIGPGKDILTGVSLCNPNGLRWCAAIWFRLPPLEGSSQVSDRVRTANTGP